MDKETMRWRQWFMFCRVIDNAGGMTLSICPPKTKKTKHRLEKDFN